MTDKQTAIEALDALFKVWGKHRTMEYETIRAALQSKPVDVGEWPVWCCHECKKETWGDDPYMKVDNEDDDEVSDVCRNCLSKNEMYETGEYRIIAESNPVHANGYLNTPQTEDTE